MKCLRCRDIGMVDSTEAPRFGRGLHHIRMICPDCQPKENMTTSYKMRIVPEWWWNKDQFERMGRSIPLLGALHWVRGI